MEKYLLRRSFDFTIFKNYENKALLPNEVLWRKKEAFSDGVSSKKKSLFEIIQENVAILLKCENVTIKKGIDAEKYYYKNIFHNYYPNCEKIVPYYWMPKYTNTEDPSARTLDHYLDASLNCN
jgi:asparagine synthase (glutamine-hydrolysing)